MPLSYDSNGVPKLDLSNPQAQVVFPRGYYTYAFGNTPGTELTENFGTSKSDGNLNFLLLGSGDVRNLLFTVSELSQRSQDAIPKNLFFHLNDHDASVLARDVIILEIVLSIDPDCEKDMDFLWNIWYNLKIPGDHFRRLQAIIDGLFSREYKKSDLQFGSRDVFTDSLKIWRDWMDMDVSLQEVLQQRQRLILFGLNLADADDMDEEEHSSNFISAVTSLTNTVIKQLLTPFDEQKLGRKCLQSSGSLYQEIYSYFLSGNTSQIHSDSKVNPTLIRPFERKWKVHYGSCPFSGYIPIDGNLFGNCKSITKACKDKLRALVKNFHNFGRCKSGYHSIKVTFWNRDALDLCRSGFPKNLLFDVIDTSNLSDHIGLLNLLVCCARRLKEPGQSQLITSTMLWRASGLCSLQEYLEYSLGMAQTLYPTVLGLKLAEDLNLGKSDIIAVKEDRRVVDRLVWVRAEPERSPISLARSPDILDAFKNMASRCFRLPSPRERCLQLTGVTLSSPLTFFVAFMQIVETLKESEGSLPSVRLFQKRACTKLCGFSWNVLKCLAGLLKGVVLKVDVKVTFPTNGLSRNTPVMQAVVFEDPSDARFLSVWSVSQLEQRTFHRPLHLFYNNVRYDPDKETASLLVLETDWETLNADSVLILISSSISRISNAVKLKHSCKARQNNVCCFANKRIDTISGKTHVTDTVRSKQRKSRLAKNISCVSVSCTSDASRKGLQKYDSSYRLDILSSQDLVIHSSGHMHSSKDCLVSQDMRPVRLFQSGVDSSSFQLNDDVVLERKLVNDVIIHNSRYEIDEEESSVTAKTARMDDIKKAFGLSDGLSLVTSQTTKTDHLQLLALEEHSMCYNADIKILITANTDCLSGSPTAECHPTDMPTAVNISLDSERKPLTLYFSSPVDEKSSKVQILEDKHHLRCHFPKSELGVYGRACIKRPNTIDFASLPTWRKMEDLNLLMLCTQTNDDSPPEEKEDFQELQNALRYIIASFVEYPQKNICFTVHMPSETDAATPNFTLVVHEVYCHNNVPLARVLFCDHSVNGFPSEDTQNSMNAAKYKEVLLKVTAEKEDNPMIHMTKEGQILFKRLLYTNAKRVTKTERLKAVWNTSLLQLRFPL